MNIGDRTLDPGDVFLFGGLGGAAAEGLGGELVGLAEAGEESCPDSGDGERADAADYGGADRAPPLGGESAFEFAEFVGCADEEGVDGADAATHFGRRS